MPASDPAGGQKFWFNGIPYDGVARSGIDTTGVKYWFNGIPMDTLTASSSPAPTVTTLYSLINVG